MQQDDTLWELQPHTVGKHRVLESYLGAWLPILSSWNKRIRFVDAFAGPGEYSGGEPGSPMIALQTLVEHSARPRMDCEFSYVFIEATKPRFDHLKDVLTRIDDRLPSNCRYQTVNSTFDESLTRVMDQLDRENKSLEPTLVMIDPFGIKGVSMNVIQRILQHPSTEVYISFMYRDINRFRDADHFEKGMDALIGTPEWRDITEIEGAEARKAQFFELFRAQLKAAGARYVVNFELYEGERLIYAIFFGTQHLEGCDQMKKAIWEHAPFGDYKFKGNMIGQNLLGEDFVDIRTLRKELIEHFGQKSWISIEEVIDFVRSDLTKYHTGHLKTRTLRPMEDDHAIEVDENTRKQKRRYPNGTRLRFLSD